MVRCFCGQGSRGKPLHPCYSHLPTPHATQNYLGHSINAPTGRWQKNKDVHWYNRDKQATDAERAEEIRKIKELEEEALAVALLVPSPPPSLKLNVTIGIEASNRQRNLRLLAALHRL